MPDTRLSYRNHWFRVWMPYQFVKLEVDRPKHVYLPLNRNYKPLGIGTPRGTEPYVEYIDYLNQAVIFSKDPHEFTGVWHDATRLYLYNDNGSTQETYFERLNKLMDRAVKLYGAPSEE